MAFKVQSPGLVESVLDIGPGAWLNPANAIASDDADVTCAGGLGGITTEWLKATQYDNPIPAHATVQGIIQRVECDGGGAAVQDDAVRLVSAAGAILGKDRSEAGDWPTGDAEVDHGGAFDLWAAAWTAKDVNDADSGCAISATVPALATARVDWLARVVHYTVPQLVVPAIKAYGRGRVYTLSWTADSEGNVVFDLNRLVGVLHRVETCPSEADAPTADWDLTLEDLWGSDVLGGLGANRSATDPEAIFPYFSLGTSGHGERGIGEGLTLKIANAGEAKSGIVRILTLGP